MKLTKILAIGLVITACGKTEKSENDDAIVDSVGRAETPEEVVPNEEITLFNGEDLEGWRGYNRSDVPGIWTVEDNTIKVSAEAESDSERGDLIFGEKLKNFEFSFEWKISKGGNSGIFYLAREFDAPIYRSAPEFQLLDNENHPDAKMGKDNNRQAGSLYDLIPAQPQNAKPFGEWNSGKIIVNDGKVTHLQNGEKVVEYELWTPEWETMIENSKFKGWTEMIEAGGETREGYLGLQDHGNDVWFRNLTLKKLD